jgi:hypothetical protein
MREARQPARRAEESSRMKFVKSFVDRAPRFGGARRYGKDNRYGRGESDESCFRRGACQTTKRPTQRPQTQANGGSSHSDSRLPGQGRPARATFNTRSRRQTRRSRNRPSGNTGAHGQEEDAGARNGPSSGVASGVGANAVASPGNAVVVSAQMLGSLRHPDQGGPPGRSRTALDTPRNSWPCPGHLRRLLPSKHLLGQTLILILSLTTQSGQAQISRGGIE